MKKFLYVAILALGVVVMMTPPVMAQDEKPFTLHGEVRMRGEYDNNASDFNDDQGVGPTDDGALFWPYRVRIAADGHFAKNISAWLEFQNAGVAGGDVTLINPTRTGFDLAGVQGNGAELYQGNITLNQLWSKNFSLRIGRQEVVAGTELLLGDLDFYAGLSHDGLVGTWKFDKWNLMAWYTRPREGSVSTVGGAGFLPPDQIGIGGGTGSDTQHFLGAYANWTVAKDQGIDVYLMSLADRSTGGNFQTIGGRYSHDVTTKNGLFWNLEYAMQIGQVRSELVTLLADRDAGGSVIEGWIGWNFKSGKNTHRVYARYTAASGDDDPTDSSNDAFMPLYGDFHNRLGHGDFFQVSGTSTELGGGGIVDDLGINAFALGWNGRFGDRSEVGAEYWSFTTNVDDANGNDALGTEFDVWYGYNYSKNLTFTASLSQFSPDDVLSVPVGFDDTVTRLYGNARFRF